MRHGPCALLQRSVLQAVADGKLPDTLLFVEHEPVFTLGAGFHRENLLLSEAEYGVRGIELSETERGGDVTYHCPGQLVMYPVFNLARHGRDLHKWLRDLEEAAIVGMRTLGLHGSRFPPHTGVWVSEPTSQIRKIAAIGVKVKRWVSMHGIALNCDNDLSGFDLIVPCGIEGLGVTSLSQELGRKVGVEDAKPIFKRAFEEVFGLDFSPKTAAWLGENVK